MFLPTSPWGREEIALFASVVLYSLCTTLVNFTLQLPQLPEAYFELQCPPRLLSGPGRTAVPTAPSPCRTARCIHLLSSFHSHCLKGSNIGSSSQKWHEETPQACPQYRPYLTNGQQRQYSLTQPILFSERDAGVKKGSKETTITWGCF